ncbi:MAG: alpha/beta fold hydrolase [Anaerolineales bacterium]
MYDIAPGLRERIFDTGEVQLHLIEAGPAKGNPVLLLHGFPEFWFGWRSQIAPLAQAGYRVVVPDQRGYNLSEKPAAVSAYSIQHLVGDAVAIIEEAGGAVDLIGHDWGAAVAWHVAMRFPEKVRKLVILNVPHPAAMQAALRSSWKQRLRSGYILFFQIPWLPERLLGMNRAAGLMRLLKSSSRAGSFPGETLDLYRQAWLQPGAIAGMLAWYRAALRFSRQTFLGQRIAAPTLILWGEKDVALGCEMARMSLEWCDDGRLIGFPTASHWVQHDESEAVNQHLLQFLGGVP